MFRGPARRSASNLHVQEEFTCELLPIFWASYYFSAPGDLPLLYEAYGFSSQAERRGVPLESSGLRFSSLR